MKKNNLHLYKVLEYSYHYRVFDSDSKFNKFVDKFNDI